MEGLKTVYQHLDQKRKVFYVGSGNKERPFIVVGRSKEWSTVANKGYSVDILGEFPKKDAKVIEHNLINKYGLENLTNKENVWLELPKEYLKAKHFSLKVEEELFKDVVVAAKEDTRSVNAEINVLLREALEARKLKKS